ncbi:hypothetical protein VPAL9027_03212 [Vibrio palustris]|uniref:Uncharacterized protein n=1 Tax=Vibrio palustris TaxID=1918946 RepID=A0A1R4B8D3_9VIBR|nr:hypothetical protein VPAL9027_03212 [Vibrio palustris]
MAGVERFELPTRTGLWKANPLRFSTTQSIRNNKQKSPSLTTEAILYGRGGEIQTPNTHGLMESESAALFYKSIDKKQQTKKPQSCD